MMMLQLFIFMSSVSLLVGHAICVLQRLHEAALDKIIDSNILHTTLLSFR